MKVFEAVTAAVASEGFDHLFAVMGDANQDLIVNLGEKHGVKFIHAHHEGSAVSMADGYARFSQDKDKMGLASVTQGPGYTNATTSLVAARLARKPEVVNYDDGASIDPRRAARYIEEKLPKDERILVFDGGHVGMVFTETFTVRSADDWAPSIDFGAIGQGLGLALGACFARPGKRVTHLTGDASFMMNVADFHTAVSHNLPLTVFVFNDNAVGQEKHDLVHKKLNPRYADVKQPNFAKLAIAFGAKGFEVNRPDDLAEIDKALAVPGGPAVVDVRINGDVEVQASWEIAQHLG